MTRLLPPGTDGGTLADPVHTALRHGPGAFPTVPARPVRPPQDHLDRLEVTGLVVRHDDGTTVGPLDLTVEAGRVTVLTGPVGAGKTTVLRALLGLVARDEGEIRWNGRLIEDPSTVLIPPLTAYLPQVPRLFSETLAQTILLGVDDAGLEEALAIACLQPDLARMGSGLDTMVGPRGVRLSGGQIQRTAAARAFVRRPDLLVVDDLSSALDVTTETQVWQRLLDRPDRPALLVVSHRERVLRAADFVIEMG